MQNGTGLDFKIENKRLMAVNVFSPPDNKDIGIKTEFHILNFFVQLGYTISITYGDNARYDFIIDIKGKLYKIQCKHGRVVDECKLMWDSCSHNPNNYNKKLEYICIK